VNNKKNILVTGADGFIGSHLVEMLLGQGHSVKALSYYNSFNHWGWLEEVPHNESLEIITGDIRDGGYCRAITKGVDIIYHLAALIAIPYSYKAPDSYVDTNIKGTVNICQAALENNVDRLIHTSTSEVYGTAKYVPIDEQHPLQPQSPYSASKIAADAMAMSFYHAFSMPITIVRPFNTYGPRQSARAIIPTIITQIAAGKKEIKLGNLTPTRDFNYVEDTCRGFLAAANSDNAVGEIVNVGSNFEISMLDTVNMIKEIMGSDVEFVQDEVRVRSASTEVYRLFCDNAKLKALTGFEPQYSLRDGLTKTINWFSQSENLKLYKTDIYNV
jgi:NAD dependent epimerase/dehydratase